MKKKGLAGLLAGAMMLLLCGCDALDEMRDAQAFYQDGKIVYEGVTYQLLPKCDEFQPKLDAEKGTIYVTASDVPVLLSTLSAEEMLYRSENGDFLWSHEKAYCRVERHGEISKRMQENFETETVCYHYMVWEDAENWMPAEYEYVLTDEQMQALETLTANVEPQILGRGMYLEYDWYIDLEACSADMLFRRDGGQIAVAGDTYYLVMEENDQQHAFQVPDGMVSIFDEITEAYHSAYDYPEYDENT